MREERNLITFLKAALRTETRLSDVRGPIVGLGRILFACQYERAGIGQLRINALCLADERTCLLTVRFTSVGALPVKLAFHAPDVLDIEDFVAGYALDLRLEAGSRADLRLRIWIRHDVLIDLHLSGDAL